PSSGSRQSLLYHSLLLKIRKGSRSCSRGLGQSLVEGALAITFEVQGNVLESGGFQGFGDRRGHVHGQSAREFVGGDFDAREFVVEAHAELAESQIAQSGFAALDQAETFGCHFSSIRKARGETRGGRAVPRGQARALRERANLGLAQTGVQKG